MGERNIYGIIYVIRNKLNNKLYIGQTIKEQGFCERYPCGNSNIERVYNYHLYRKENNCSYNDHLLKSIKKYGFEVFEIDEVFDMAYSKNELDSLEKLYISIYNTINPEYGYNKTSGGSNGVPNEEIRKKLSDARMGEKHPYYGKTLSIEHRSKMSENRKGNKNPMYGKRKNLDTDCELIKKREFSEEHKINLRESHPDFKRGNHPSAKKIVCISTKIIFNCIKNGAEYYNVSYCGLKAHLKNKKSLSYGETLDGEKLIWDYYEHYIKENNEEGLIYEEDLRTIK